jgi:hypothetical protein
LAQSVPGRHDVGDLDQPLEVRAVQRSGHLVGVVGIRLDRQRAQAVRCAQVVRQRGLWAVEQHRLGSVPACAIGWRSLIGEQPDVAARAGLCDWLRIGEQIVAAAGLLGLGS